MNPEFLEKIENPETIMGTGSLEQQSLLDSALKESRKRLSEYGIHDLDDWLLYRLAYIYYHNWEENDPSYMILLEDPGDMGDHVVAEIPKIKALGRDPNPLDLIEIYQRIGARWLMGRDYAYITSQVLEAFNQFDLIDFDGDWWEYMLSGRFFDDFYMGDTVKYRADYNDVPDSCFTQFLRKELESVDPDFIFIFGGDGWDVICEKLNPVPVSLDLGSSNVCEENLGAVLGEVFRSEYPVETYLAPLYHVSYVTRGWADISREEYIEAIQGSVRDWQEYYS